MTSTSWNEGIPGVRRALEHSPALRFGWDILFYGTLVAAIASYGWGDTLTMTEHIVSVAIRLVVVTVVLLLVLTVASQVVNRRTATESSQ